MNQKEIIKLDIDIIVKIVCDKYDLHPDVIKSKTRKREIVTARQIIWSIIRDLFGEFQTFEKIGNSLGTNHSHCNVVHGVTKVKNLCDIYKSFRYDYDEMLHKSRVKIKSIINYKNIKKELDEINGINDIQKMHEKINELIKDFDL